MTYDALELAKREAQNERDCGVGDGSIWDLVAEEITDLRAALAAAQPVLEAARRFKASHLVLEAARRQAAAHDRWWKGGLRGDDYDDAYREYIDACGRTNAAVAGRASQEGAAPTCTQCNGVGYWYPYQDDDRPWPCRACGEGAAPAPAPCPECGAASGALVGRFVPDPTGTLVPCPSCTGCAP